MKKKRFFNIVIRRKTPTNIYENVKFGFEFLIRNIVFHQPITFILKIMNLDSKIPHLLKEDTTRKYEAFLSAAKDAGVSLSDDSEFINSLKRVFTFSDFIFKSCTREPKFLKDLHGSGDLQRTFEADEFHKKLKSYLIDVKDDAQLSRQLRWFRRYQIGRASCRERV